MKQSGQLTWVTSRKWRLKNAWNVVCELFASWLENWVHLFNRRSLLFLVEIKWDNPSALDQILYLCMWNEILGQNPIRSEKSPDWAKIQSSGTGTGRIFDSAGKVKEEKSKFEWCLPAPKSHFRFLFDKWWPVSNYPHFNDPSAQKERKKRQKRMMRVAGMAVSQNVPTVYRPVAEECTS